MLQVLTGLSRNTENCHSDRSEPTLFLFAFAPANASARVVEEPLFDRSAEAPRLYACVDAATPGHSCFKKILNNIAFTNIVTSDATNVAL
jgi:hypothetical protein